MSQFTDVFLQFIDSWGYYAVAILMGLENACIPIPSELISGLLLNLLAMAANLVSRFMKI